MDLDCLTTVTMWELNTKEMRRALKNPSEHWADRPVWPHFTSSCPCNYILDIIRGHKGLDAVVNLSASCATLLTKHHCCSSHFFLPQILFSDRQCKCGATVWLNGSNTTKHLSHPDQAATSWLSLHNRCCITCIAKVFLELVKEFCSDSMERHVKELLCGKKHYYFICNSTSCLCLGISKLDVLLRTLNKLCWITDMGYLAYMKLSINIDGLLITLKTGLI